MQLLTHKCICYLVPIAQGRGGPGVSLSRSVDPLASPDQNDLRDSHKSDEKLLK